MNSVAIAPGYVHASVKRRKNVWYTQKNGNWNDPTIWESNAIKRWSYPGQNIPTPVFPQVGDDVYINHTITLNAGSNVSAIVINNLYIGGGGTFKADNLSRYITINGDLQAVGIVDFTSSNITVNLLGVNNFINTFSAGSSTISYARILTGDQNIMPLTYYNLMCFGLGTKYATSNLTITNNLLAQSSIGNVTNAGTMDLQLSSYNLSVSGTSTFSNAARLVANGSGTILFTGNMVTNFSGCVNFSGNPTIEFRGGILWQSAQAYSSSYNNWGTGTISFTTNNQNVEANIGSITMSNPITITGAITITNVNGSSYWEIDNYIDGTVAGSALINKGSLYIGSTTLPMATNGTYDFTTYSTNTLGYVMNSAYSIPVAAYKNLLISGSGTKTLAGNVTVSGNLTISNVRAAASFDPGANSLIITGTTTVSQSIFICTGGASLKFTGKLTNTGGATIDFSTGNPSVELAGGGFDSPITFKSGSGTWTFSTANQIINLLANTTFVSNILVSGAITVQVTGSAASFITITGTVNGNNANSIFDNRKIVHYQNATAPMVTGKLYCNQAANTWIYDLAGNQDIQVLSDPVSPGYSNLTLAGSGAKRLLGNVSVKGTYTLTPPATLNSNGFALTNP